MERLRYFENYLEICKEIKKEVNKLAKARVFVFGSVVRGDFSVGLSDIDIAVVSNKFSDRSLKLKVHDSLFLKHFNSPLEFHLLTEKQWEFYKKFIEKDFIEI